jgi:NitT/TauT family transport system permease protein
VESDDASTSWFLEGLQRSPITAVLNRRLLAPLFTRLNEWLERPQTYVPSLDPAAQTSRRSRVGWLLLSILALIIGYGIFEVFQMLATLPLSTWGSIAVGAGTTFLRVSLAVGIALLWTIPIGVWIGTSASAARLLQPVVQILAAIPATALFPVLLIGLAKLPNGYNLAAVLLMLLGTQWYLLFNIIAGASAIPQDLLYTTELLQLRGWKRWRTLILPSLFPYIITGLITAGGGAWNASIVAEYATFGGQTSRVTGLGALITAATASGDYSLLLAATLTMIVIVLLVNRLFWRRLYHIAETRFRMDQ